MALPSWVNDTVTRIRAGTIEERGTIYPDWDHVNELDISGCSMQPAGTSLSQAFIEKEESIEDSDIVIERTKKFDIKPMYPEDACVQMELLGHSFYVFMNADTDELNVVYKRKGGTYGLIEPED